MRRPTSLLRLASVLALAACGGTPPEGMDAGPSDAGRDASAIDAWIPPLPTTVIPAANALSPADPGFDGQQRFLYDAWGTERLDEWPPADFMIALMTSEPAVFGDQYASFGFVPDPDDDLPVGFKRGLEDSTRVHQTCALCHVGRLPDGTLWLGMPNLTLDIARFRLEVNARWVAAGNPSLMSPTDESKALSYGPGRFAAESGEYPIAVSADFPPYWLLGERTAMNYLGTGGNVRTEVFLAVFTFGAGDPTNHDGLLAFPSASRVDPFIAFMGSMGSPPAPPQDGALVASGEAVFARERCGDCHHVADLAMNGVTPYDRAADGRDRAPGDDPEFPMGSIHTDYLHRILIDGEPEADSGVPGEDAGAVDGGPLGSDPGRLALIQFIARNRLAVRLSDGYRVDDLHGLWATAPYLHNGSVPTLDDLLRPAAERPTTFMRGEFVVDTTLPANSNMGHEFGVTLDETDRAALVAYLLSL
jgi:hypothetical protein